MATFLEIRDAARQRSDMVKSKFVTEAELKGYVNASVKELYDLLVSTFDDYYTAEPLEFELTGVEDGYNLPDDFYKLRGLDRQIDSASATWFTVHNFNFEERNRYNQFTAIRSSYPAIRYRVMGSSDLEGNGFIKIIPKAGAGGTYRMWYVPKCPTLVADGDEFNGINGWEEYVIVDCAIKMLEKQEDDVSVFLAQKKALIERIEAMAPNRDAGEPERITDSRSSDWIGPFGWNGGGSW